MNAVELAAHAGVSYRRIDHWTRLGYLHPINPNCGTGHERYYPPGETTLAVRMARLVNAGLALTVAHAVAQGDPSAVDPLRKALEECA